MRKILSPLSFVFITLVASPFTPEARGQCAAQALTLAQQQLSKTLNYIGASQFPQATVLNTQGTFSAWNSYSAYSTWGSGFFPGLIWYMYEQTLDPTLLSRAQAQTANMYGETTDAQDSDVGFKIMASYGNGYAITRDPSYMSAIQTGANTLASLYVSSAGAINTEPYFNNGKVNEIIDSMPALEILFHTAQNGGNPNWYNIAVSHALKLMQNNVRADGSTYQGVRFNSDGTVYSYFTNDGYSPNSTWSRGQAWGLYGLFHQPSPAGLRPLLGFHANQL